MFPSPRKTVSSVSQKSLSHSSVMVYAAPPLRERALRPGRWGDDEALLAGVARGDGGGDGIPVLTSNPPPRSACPAGRVVEALQGHVDGIDGVGAGLDVRAGGDFLGRLVVITTTITVLIGIIRH